MKRSSPAGAAAAARSGTGRALSSRAVVRLACALLVVLALAACDDDGGGSYGEELPAIDRDLAGLGADVGATVRDASSLEEATLAERFERYAERLADARGRLAELEPPQTLTADHERLLAAAATEHRALAEIAAAASRGGAAAAGAAATRAVRAGAQLDAVRRQLAERARAL